MEVKQLEEAEEVAKNDPTVLEEKFQYVVRAWKPLEGLLAFWVGSLVDKPKKDRLQN